MKDRFAGIKKKLTSPAAKYLYASSAGALIGGTCIYFKIQSSPRVLNLGKEAYEALVNDETNHVIFSNDLHDHAFRVTLEY